MIDYFYLLDYESDNDTCLCMVETEPAAAADLAIENLDDIVILEDVVKLKKWFPRYDMRKCFEALTENDLDYHSAYNTLFSRNAKELQDRSRRSKRKRDAEAPV